MSIKISGTTVIDNSKNILDVTLKNYAETYITVGNFGSSSTLGISTGGYFKGTLNQSTTFVFNSSGIPTGGYYGFAIEVKNGSGGPFSITWPASIYWPDGGSTPSRNTTAGRTDVWSFSTTDDGTSWLGNLSITNYTI